MRWLGLYLVIIYFLCVHMVPPHSLVLWHVMGYAHNVFHTANTVRIGDKIRANANGVFHSGTEFPFIPNIFL